MDTEPGREPLLSHHHSFREDLNDMWCHNCQTVTDFCKELNDFGQEVPLPAGFREGVDSSLACPHRDLSVCDFCAGRYAEIVEVFGAHFWVSHPEERYALRNMYPKDSDPPSDID